MDEPSRRRGATSGVVGVPVSPMRPCVEFVGAELCMGVQVAMHALVVSWIEFVSRVSLLVHAIRPVSGCVPITFVYKECCACVRR